MQLMIRDLTMRVLYPVQIAQKILVRLRNSLCVSLCVSIKEQFFFRGGLLELHPDFRATIPTRMVTTTTLRRTLSISARWHSLSWSSQENGTCECIASDVACNYLSAPMC